MIGVAVEVADQALLMGLVYAAEKGPGFIDRAQSRPLIEVSAGPVTAIETGDGRQSIHAAATGAAGRAGERLPIRGLRALHR